MVESQLRKLVNELEPFLRDRGYVHWIRKLKSATSHPQLADSAQAVLSNFGGMGSLNDIILDEQGTALLYELAGLAHRIIDARGRGSFE